MALNLKKTTQQLVSSHYDTFLIVFISNLNSISSYNVIKISLVLLHMILRAVCCFNVTIFKINGHVVSQLNLQFIQSTYTIHIYIMYIIYNGKNAV